MQSLIFFCHFPLYESHKAESWSLFSNAEFLIFTESHGVMTVIKIFVKGKHQANMLYRMLKKLPFVESIEKVEQEPSGFPNDQQAELSRILNQFADPGLFKDTDPVLWQKSSRDEWEENA